MESSEEFLNSLRQALTGGSELTHYQAAQIVTNSTGEPLTTVQVRHGRWVKGRGLKTVTLLARDLGALGYELKIVRR